MQHSLHNTDDGVQAMCELT